MHFVKREMFGQRLSIVLGKANLDARRGLLFKLPCAPSGGPSLYSGHPALRPSGQLRCSRRSCGAVVTLLLATQEKVTRAPKEGESSVLTVRAKSTAPSP